MSIQIRVIEDQHTEEKTVEQTQEIINQVKREQGINQNPFISEEDQMKAFYNQTTNNPQYKFAPKPGDTLSNREVKSVDFHDDFKIQIEIRTDMPNNR